MNSKKYEDAADLSKMPLSKQVHHWSEIVRMIKDDNEIPDKIKNVYRKILNKKKKEFQIEKYNKLTKERNDDE